MQVWKVGELAKRTGLSVRALHHYDALGVLVPSARSAAGYRLYTEGDVVRLQQVVSLRGLGFALEEIRVLLQKSELSVHEVVGLHLARLREEVEAKQRLYVRLESLAASLCSAESISVEAFLTTIEEITMFEKYYTPEQLEQLRQRREALGEEHIREVEAEWPRLMAAVRSEMEKGTDPADPEVQRLMVRWRELVAEFTGGDAGIAKSLGSLLSNEGEALRQQHGSAPDPELMGYVGRAMAARG
jgi:DNA-binding transcriptional MerR regulator